MKLFNDREINWIAYEQGFKAYKDFIRKKGKTPNPYKRESDNWYSWNKGWNAA